MAGHGKLQIDLTLVVLGLAGLTAQQGCAPAPINTPTQQYQAVTPAEAQDLIQSRANDPNFEIVDVRTPAEFASGHIAGAVTTDVLSVSPSFSDAISGLDKSRTYLVYCGSQHRSPTAISIMQQQGFMSLYELIGGLGQWRADGLPVVQ